LWCCLKDGFISVVEDYSSSTSVRDLLVRARLPGNLEQLFPNAVVREDEGTDYRFRATIPREIVAQALFDHVMAIDYTNFKSSVKSRPLHDAYMGFWTIMHRLQERMR
jgi:hypothetical protein